MLAFKTLNLKTQLKHKLIKKPKFCLNRLIQKVQALLYQSNNNLRSLLFLKSIKVVLFIEVLYLGKKHKTL